MDEFQEKKKERHGEMLKQFEERAEKKKKDVQSVSLRWIDRSDRSYTDA